MVDLPKLDLTCLKSPSRCVLVAESCVNCRNRNIVLAHTAAYFKDYKNGMIFWGGIRTETLMSRDAKAARDAVLKLAGLTPKDIKNNGGD